MLTVLILYVIFTLGVGLFMIVPSVLTVVFDGIHQDLDAPPKPAWTITAKIAFMALLLEFGGGFALFYYTAG